jgi:head-tail adaptor
VRSYRPQRLFSSAFMVRTATVRTVKGVAVKDWQDAGVVFGSFVTFGGTEREVNGVRTVADTARMECFYDPRIVAGCRLLALDTGREYDVDGTPEDVEGRGQFMSVRLERAGGMP